MAITNENFITQMKLSELRKQRDRVLLTYENLTQAAANALDDSDRFLILQEGLKNLTFAGKALHPDVASLRLLRHSLGTHPNAISLLRFWLNHLEAEIRYGHNRAEMVFVFGSLLEEWAFPKTKPAKTDRRQQIRETLISAVITPVAIGNHEALLLPLLNAYRAATQKKQPHADAIRKRVTQKEVQGHLRRIRGDIYRPGDLRQQAQQLLADEEWQREFADAMTILLDNLDTWSWDETGVKAQAVLARNKWRLLLDEDLPTATMLEILGTRWHYHFFESLMAVKNRLINRQNRLAHLIELNAPEVILENERRMLAEAEEENPTQPDIVNIWAEFESNEDNKKNKSRNDYQSIQQRRINTLHALREFNHLDTYSGSSIYTNAIHTALMLINAEIQLARAAFPEHPFYIIKIDLKDYYPSISHPVIQTILDGLNLPENDKAFFNRYLQIPIHQGDTVVMSQRGLTSHRILSDVLGEVLLRLLDDYVQNVAQVMVVRIVDDICFLTPSREKALLAWQAVQTFCAACGLSVNMEKSGSVCIGGDQLAELPTARPNWLLLELDEQGNWHVNEAKFLHHLAQVQRRVNQASSVISQVEFYNSGLNYLLTSLVLPAALGETHRNDIRAALSRFHYTFAESAGSLGDILRQKISEQYLKTTATETLPEAILYWPITAGGLGITQAMVIDASHAETLAKRKAPIVPDKRKPDWQHRNNDWAKFYGEHLNPVKPAAPDETKIMETLVNDFIQRGSTLTGGRQKDLSTYWRWILYLYGQQILDTFGTFRFLIEELVPLQLIIQQRMDDSSLFDDEGSDNNGNIGDVRVMDNIPF